MTILEFFSTYPLAYLGFVILIGLAMGSFLNVVIYRLPVMMERNWHRDSLAFLAQNAAQDTDRSDASVSEGDSDTVGNGEDAKQETFNLAIPDSRCPHCNHAIRAWENIPVVSYLLLRGKCSSCHAPISPRYPLVELVTAILSGFIAYHFGVSWSALLALIFTWALITLTLIDYDQHLLPDNITLPLLWFGLAANISGVFCDLDDAVIGAIAGYLLLWSVYWLFKLATGKEGMGYGDFKLLAALGAWLGWQSLPLIILLSSSVGALWGLLLIIFAGRDSQRPMPFGPYLAVAGWIAMIWGQKLSALFYF